MVASVSLMMIYLVPSGMSLSAPIRSADSKIFITSDIVIWFILFPRRDWGDSEVQCREDGIDYRERG